MSLGNGHMVIIGGGKAGARAAVALRENGHEDAITLITGEAHAPYDRPPLSKSIITETETPSPPYLTDEALLASINVSLITSNPASSIDRAAKSVLLSNGKRVSYEKLLLATGALPRKLPLPGADLPQVRTLRTYEDAMALRDAIMPGKHIIIIGGGFIGLEVASSARKRGAEVTLIEGLPRVLSRGVPEDVATVVAKRHADEGVDIRTSTGLTGFDADGGKITVRLADGGVMSGDLVLVGIGAVPVTDLAAQAGLAIDNGIAVDDELRTSDPDIYAAGDCVSFPLTVYGGRRVRLESWRSAQDQGELAAANMLGKEQKLVTVPWFWSDQYELTLQIAGLQDEGTHTVRRDLSGTAFVLFHIAADGRLVAASGIGEGNAVAKDIRLAEMIIAKGLKPAPNQLADPAVNLKRLLAG
jgi:3-phenylpropionate/trans-cinnamate dioxygenase ferredoxin reductase component